MTKKKVKTVAPVETTPEPDVMLKVKEAARILSCAVVTVQRLIDSGQVPHMRFSGVQRIPRSGLMKFIAENTQNGHNDNHVD